MGLPRPPSLCQGRGNSGVYWLQDARRSRRSGRSSRREAATVRELDDFGTGARSRGSFVLTRAPADAKGDTVPMGEGSHSTIVVATTG